MRNCGFKLTAVLPPFSSMAGRDPFGDEFFGGGRRHHRGVSRSRTGGPFFGGFGGFPPFGAGFAPFDPGETHQTSGCSEK